MTETSVFRETKCPEMMSQSFPVSCVRYRGFYPTGSEISRFWYIKTQGRKIAILYFFPYLSVHCGDFIEQIEKNLSYTL